MKHLFCIIFFNIFILVGLFAQESNQEFVNLIHQAIEKSPVIQLSAEDVKKSERELKSAKASFFPHLYIQGSVGADLFRLDRFNDNNYGSTMILDWDFFQNGALFYRLDSARSQHYISELAHQKKIVDLIFEIKNLFFEYYESLLLYQTSKLEFELMTNKFQIFDKDLEIGKITYAEWFKEKMNFNELQNQLLISEDALSSKEEKIQYFLGEDFDVSKFDWDQLLACETELIDFKQVDKKIFDLKYEYLESQTQLKLSQKAYRLAKWRKWPRISLFTGSDFGVDDLGSESSQIEFRTGAIVRYPLFDGGMTKNQILLSKLAYERTLLNHEILSKNIERDLNNKYKAIEFSLKKLEYEKKYFEVSQQDFQKAEIDYEHGKISPIELKELELILRRNQNRYYLSKIDVLRRQAEFANFFSCGWVWEIVDEVD